MKIVFVLGAGATLSDVATRPLKERPPLDRGFFKIAKAAHPTLAGTVASYMNDVYEYDIYATDNDSLERVMGQIYTGTFNPGLRRSATQAFRALLRLFNRRVADTTNDIRPIRQRWLYRMLAGFLSARVVPKDITIITYNQDLQVEKTLCLLAERSRWGSVSNEIFSFPGCYSLGPHNVTSPTYEGVEIFTQAEPADGCIKLLKTARFAQLVFVPYQQPAEPERNVQSQAEVEHHDATNHPPRYDCHRQALDLCASCGRSTGDPQVIRPTRRPENGLARGRGCPRRGR